MSRKGHQVALLTCTLGTALYPVLMGFLNDPRWLPAIAIVKGFFITGIDLVFFDTMLGICPAEHRANFISCNTLLSSLAISVGPLMGSLLADWMDIRLVFFVSAGLHVVCVVLFAKRRVTMD